MPSPTAQLHKKIDLRALPKAQARVEIAKDVLAGLQIKVFDPKCVTGYCMLQSDVLVEELKNQNGHAPRRNARDFREALATKTIKSCEVCALGALFVAKVARLDQVGLMGYYARSFIVADLEEFFTSRQLALIEWAFEGYKQYRGQDVSSKFTELSRAELAEATNFVRHVDLQDTRVPFDGTARLAAIMNNIIENDGEFVP